MSDQPPAPNDPDINAPGAPQHGVPYPGWFRQVFLCRCPRCGQGKLFSGVLTVRAQCPECGLDLRGHDHGDGPLFFVLFFFCFATTVGALALEFALFPPVWVHVLVWPLFTVGGIILMLRPTKALMLRYQYKLIGTDERPFEDDGLGG